MWVVPVCWGVGFCRISIAARFHLYTPYIPERTLGISSRIGILVIAMADLSSTAETVLRKRHLRKNEDGNVFETFATAKREEGNLRNFNISVVTSIVFWDAYQRGAFYDLVNPRMGTVVNRKEPRRILDLIKERIPYTSKLQVARPPVCRGLSPCLTGESTRPVGSVVDVRRPVNGQRDGLTTKRGPLLFASPHDDGGRMSGDPFPVWPFFPACEPKADQMHHRRPWTGRPSRCRPGEAPPTTAGPESDGRFVSGPRRP